MANHLGQPSPSVTAGNLRDLIPMSSTVSSSSSGFENLFTPLTGNNLVEQFGEPTAVNNAIAYYAIPAALASYGGNTSWNLAQWGQATPINTANYMLNDTAMSDPVYGTPVLAWSNSGNTPSLAVYNSGTATVPDYVYSMTDGSQTAEGDLFLQSAQGPLISANLSEMTNVQLTMKIPTVDVGASCFNFDLGFTMNFNGADGLRGVSGFMQIVPFSTRASGTDANSGTSAQYMTSYINGFAPQTGPIPQFIWDANLSDPILPNINQDAKSAPITLQYNLNKYAQALVDEYFQRLPASQQAVYDNLANWQIGGIYAGPASYNLIGGTTDNSKVTTQLSNISVQVDPNTTFNPNSSLAGSETVNGPVMQFVDGPITDIVEGAAMVAAGGAYDRYLYTGNDNLELSVPGALAGIPWEFGGGNAQTTLYGGTVADTLIGGAQGGSFYDYSSGSTIVLAGGVNVIGNLITNATIERTGAAASIIGVGSVLRSGSAGSPSIITFNGSDGIVTVDAIGSVSQVENAVLGAPKVSISGSDGVLASKDSVSTSGNSMTVTGAAPDTIDGSSLSITGSYNLETFSTLDLITGDGNNTVFANSGMNTIHTRGTSQVTIYGTSTEQNTVAIGIGKTNVVLDGSASVDAYVGPAYASPITVDASGAAAGTPFVNVDGVNGSVTFIGGSYGNMTQMTVRGGAAGNNLLEGNNAPAMLIGGGNGDTLIAGSGTASIFGTNDLFASHGNETLIATANTTNNLFQPHGGIDFESSAGSGTQWFFSGNDASTVVGSTVAGSTNIFYMGNPSIGAGSSYIENFRLGQDSMVAINNTSIQSVMADTVNGISGTLVILSDGTTAFFKDLTSSSIESIAASNNFTQF